VSSQCDRWPACACGRSNGTRREYDPCGRAARTGRPKLELRLHHRQALEFLRNNPGDEIGEIDSECKLAAAVVFAELKNAGYVDGSTAAGSGGLRLTPMGEFAIAEQGTAQ